MMLFCAGLVVFSAAAAIASLLSGFGARLFLPALRRIEPERRLTFLHALLAAPWLLGVYGLLLSVGPCLHQIVLGLPDGCDEHGGEIELCLFHPSQATFLGAVVSVLCALPLLVALGRIAAGVRSSRQLLRRVLPLSRRNDEGILLTPGSGSFVAGWPTAEICVGRDLGKTLSAGALRAVVAHEIAHVRRGDLHRRLAARLLSAVHFPRGARLLAAEFDLATEQACDAEAADAVSDPLLVAQALVDVARLGAAPGGFASAFTDGPLEERVRALCAPAWTHPGVAWLVLPAVAVFTGGMAFSRSVHDVSERLVQLLGS